MTSTFRCQQPWLVTITWWWRWVSPDEDDCLIHWVMILTEWWSSPSVGYLWQLPSSDGDRRLMTNIEQWVSWVVSWVVSIMVDEYHGWWVVPSDDTRWVVGDGWLSWTMPVIFCWLSLSHDNHPLMSIIGWWLLLVSWVSPDDNCHLM